MRKDSETKKRKCLKCDRPIVTTKEWRLCPPCRVINQTETADDSWIARWNELNQMKESKV